MISLYEDLLALPAAAKPDEQERLQREEDESALIVHSTASRLLPDDPPGTTESSEHSLAQGLRQLQNVSHSETTDSQLSSEGEGVSQAISTLPTYIALISRLQHILPSVQTFRSSLSAGGGEDGTAAYTIPVGLMVEKEWMALVRYCVSDFLENRRVVKLLITNQLLENDPHAAEEVVKLMQVRLSFYYRVAILTSSVSVPVYPCSNSLSTKSLPTTSNSRMSSRLSISWTRI